MGHRKGAIGMSVETLVIIIISLVVLIGGISLLYKWIGGAESMKDQLDEKTNSELERLLVEQGKQVALPRNVADLTRGENHIFGIGILNTDYENKFRIEVTPPTEIANPEGKIISVLDLDPAAWLLFNDQLITLKQGEHVKEFINVKVPKENTDLGQYIFSVKVKCIQCKTPSGEIKDIPYGNTQKIIVNVKG
ncbi:MAG: hypothetical protein V2A62_02530 [Candidatus Woesearchaeota archaeon]